MQQADDQVDLGSQLAQADGQRAGEPDNVSLPNYGYHQNLFCSASFYRKSHELLLFDVQTGALGASSASAPEQGLDPGAVHQQVSRDRIVVADPSWNVIFHSPLTCCFTSSQLPAEEVAPAAASGAHPDQNQQDSAFHAQVVSSR
jgi:hypothetical protein